MLAKVSIAAKAFSDSEASGVAPEGARFEEGAGFSISVGSCAVVE